jgi:hypothetical protein
MNSSWFAVQIIANKYFRVVAYNILCGPSYYGETSIHEESLYRSGQYRYWNKRRRLVIRALQKQDLYLLTEVTQHTLTDILESLPTHVKLAIFKTKENYPDGSAILYNSLRFHLMSSSFSTMKNGPHIMVYGTFIDYVSTKILTVIALHLKAGHRPIDEKRRQFQFDHVMSVISNTIKYTEHLIIGGDINSKHLPCYISQKYHLRDTSDTSGMVTYSHYTHEQLDCLFVSNTINGSTQVASIDQNDILPNAYHGSDHLPLYLNASFQEQKKK